MPGLAIDRFDDVAIIHADSPELFERWRAVLHEDLAAVAGSAYVKIHPRTPSHLPASALPHLAPDEPAWGSSRAEVTIVEQGVHFVVRPPSGLSVGLFLDMRDVRAWVRRNAANRSVLNLFAYTCGFGVCAMLGNAGRVVNVDRSRPYVNWGMDNYRLNNLLVDPRDFIYGDALDWLARFRRRGSRFDLVIVDPPSFSSRPFSVTRDYPRLVEAAARVTAPTGILVAATNHAGTSDKRFEGWLQTGLGSAGRHGEVVQRWYEPEADFPVAPRRNPYLKVRALVLD